MSSRLADYNAFLTSLFYKDTKNLDADKNKWKMEGIPINFEDGLFSDGLPNRGNFNGIPSGGVITEYMAEAGAYNTLVAGKAEVKQETDHKSQTVPHSQVTQEEMFKQGKARGWHMNNYKGPSASDLGNSSFSSMKDSISTPNPLTYNQPAEDSEHVDHIPPRPRARSSHNIIEQRYRNKINDKFTALQNSVPSLRVTAKKKLCNMSVPLSDQKPYNDEGEYDDYYVSSSHNSDSEEDLEGLEPARKLNKGIILSKSIEYIRFLEEKNMKMRLENESLIAQARLMGINVQFYTNNDQ